MSFGNVAQAGFYGWEYGGVYLDGVIVAVVYMIVWGLVKKVGGKHSFSSDNNKVIL